MYTVMTSFYIVDFDNDLHASRRSSGSVVLLGPLRCSDAHSVEAKSEVRMLGVSLITFDSKAEDPDVEVGGRVEVARKDLAPQ